MSEFKVVEVLKMEGSRMTGMTLGEDPSWREANIMYLSHQGRRKGARKIQGTPALIRQDAPSFYEMSQPIQR